MSRTVAGPLNLRIALADEAATAQRAELDAARKFVSTGAK